MITYFTGQTCDLVLVARSMEGLEATKAAISTAAPEIGVHLIQADLGELESLKSVFTEAANFADSNVLIHNAATTNDVTRPAIHQTDPKILQDYFGLNFTSMCVLTGHFLSRFESGNRVVINISSAIYKVSTPSLSFYAASKSARNTFMSTLAAENPDVRIMSCALVKLFDTSMPQNVKEQTFSEDLRKYIEQQYAKNLVSSCEQIISKLVQILKEDKFENGAVLDF